jgi:hypothetical protein
MEEDRRRLKEDKVSWKRVHLENKIKWKTNLPSKHSRKPPAHSYSAELSPLHEAFFKLPTWLSLPWMWYMSSHLLPCTCISRSDISFFLFCNSDEISYLKTWYSR